MHRSSTAPPDVSLEDNVSTVAGRHFCVTAGGMEGGQPAEYTVELVAEGGTDGFRVFVDNEGGDNRAELRNRGDKCKLRVRDQLRVARNQVHQLLPRSRATLSSDAFEQFY
jgi:hypothetical protein